MKVYLAYSGDLDKHGQQSFDLIGVFQDKTTAIDAIEQSMKDVDIQNVEKSISPNESVYWTEMGMDIVTVGYLEVRDLL